MLLTVYTIRDIVLNVMNTTGETLVHGRHACADFYGCDPAILDDEAALIAILTAAAKAAGATILGVSSHKFAPQGVTVLLLLAESHMSIHTWPEENFAAADAFTCGQSTDPLVAIEHIRNAIKATSANNTVIPRGSKEIMQ